SFGTNVLVHASNSVNLQTASVTLDPTAILKADHSTLSLAGSNITIMGSNAISSPASSGLFLTVGEWSSLAGSFEDIDLIAMDLTNPSNPKTGALIFNGLSGSDQLAAVRDTLTIDAGLLTGRVNGVDTDSTVSLAAQTIVLQNASGAVSAASPSKGNGQIAFQSQEMRVGKG